MPRKKKQKALSPEERNRLDKERKQRKKELEEKKAAEELSRLEGIERNTNWYDFSHSSENTAAMCRELANSFKKGSASYKKALKGELDFSTVLAKIKERKDAREAKKEEVLKNATFTFREEDQLLQRGDGHSTDTQKEASSEETIECVIEISGKNPYTYYITFSRKEKEGLLALVNAYDPSAKSFEFSKLEGEDWKAAIELLCNINMQYYKQFDKANNTKVYVNINDLTSEEEKSAMVGEVYKNMQRLQRDFSGFILISFIVSKILEIYSEQLEDKKAAKELYDDIKKKEKDRLNLGEYALIQEVSDTEITELEGVISQYKASARKLFRETTPPTLIPLIGHYIEREEIVKLKEQYTPEHSSVFHEAYHELSDIFIKQQLMVPVTLDKFMCFLDYLEGNKSINTLYQHYSNYDIREIFLEIFKILKKSNKTALSEKLERAFDDFYSPLDRPADIMSYPPDERSTVLVANAMREHVVGAYTLIIDIMDDKTIDSDEQLLEKLYYLAALLSPDSKIRNASKELPDKVRKQNITDTFTLTLEALKDSLRAAYETAEPYEIQTVEQMILDFQHAVSIVREHLSKEHRGILPDFYPVKQAPVAKTKNFSPHQSTEGTFASIPFAIQNEDTLVIDGGALLRAAGTLSEFQAKAKEMKNPPSIPQEGVQKISQQMDGLRPPLKKASSQKLQPKAPKPDALWESRVSQQTQPPHTKPKAHNQGMKGGFLKGKQGLGIKNPSSPPATKTTKSSPAPADSKGIKLKIQGEVLGEFTHAEVQNILKNMVSRPKGEHFIKE